MGSKGAKSAKGSKGSIDPASGKPAVVILKLTLDRDVARLLRLEAFGRDCSLGRVVEDLVRASPRRFVLTDRSKGLVVAEGSSVPDARASEGASRPAGAVPVLGIHAEVG